ncbi:MAG: metalloregulator ArsR/SmtB family transcription factor [Candidatus Marinimicrobia bacterium]|nr:metalloregulator ArsR/SmtB family transcription factor [Candidatus Neomarinimicrobiota bacterium]
MIDEFVISKTAKLFNVLSSEIRIKIIYHLMENNRLSVTELSEKLNIPQNTLSSHLKILYDGSYINKEQKWRNVNYSIREKKLEKIIEIAISILNNKWEGNWEKIDRAKKSLNKMINSQNKKRK